MKQNNILKKVLVLVLGLSSSALFGQTYTFTNASAVGVTGPSQVQVDAAYVATNLAGNVTVVGQGMQEWIVPVTANYSISAAGASGGFTPNALGGQGREVTVNVTLTAGDVIRITVGQEGGRAEFSTPGYAGGGGGGTFIINQTTGNPILIVGGGGGAGEGNGSYVAVLNGVDAADYNIEDGTDGTGYAGSWSTAGIGGVAGAGGTTASGGSGGGGYTGDGQLGTFGGNIGNSYTNGVAGGTNKVLDGVFTLDIPGGFGGGAGAGIHSNFEANGGGAGGYSGGGGSNTRVGSGGGGGNFYTGNYVSSSLNTGHGQAVITVICANSISNYTVASCNNYTVPSGDETYNVSGVYNDTIPNATGCDSIMTITVDILTPSISSYNIDACDSYTVPSGDETYNVSGVYNDTISNASGCDSIMTITVNITTIDLTTTVNNFTMSANDNNASYQWITCADNQPISGATNQTYLAEANGDYAVIITNGPCSDTSVCVTIAGVGIDEVGLLSVVEIYPNPNNGEFTINTTLPNAIVSIYGIDGKLILSNIKITQSNQQINLENVETGVYFVTVKNKVNQKTIKLIIQ